MISKEMRVLVMVLVGYGRNDNRLRVSEKVDWMVFHSGRKHVHQRLLPEIQQFPESER